MTPRETLLEWGYVARDYRLRLRDIDGLSTVTAVVGCVRGETLAWVDRIVTPAGEVVAFTSLRASRRNHLTDDLIAADSIVRDIGDTTCGHGRYLLTEFCVRCLVAAKDTP